MRKNVKISLWYNHGEPDENAFPDAPELGKSPHAQEAMRHMGITYAEAEPHPISDCWVFFDCTGIPDGPLPKWMTVSEGGMTAQEIYDRGMLRVKTEPAPPGQKFPVGARVRVSNGTSGYSVGLSGRGRTATVIHTYAHAFGGANVESYCLNVDGIGVSAWYDEAWLSAE